VVGRRVAILTLLPNQDRVLWGLLLTPPYSDTVGIQVPSLYKSDVCHQYGIDSKKRKNRS
jgi:hypothetical protein